MQFQLNKPIFWSSKRSPSTNRIITFSLLLWRSWRKGEKTRPRCRSNAIQPL